MKKQYYVKSRNWHGRKWVRAVMEWICDRFDASYSEAEDNDIKVGFETFSPWQAWTFWALMQALKRWSGGWAYIVRPGRKMDAWSYKSIY